MKIGFFPLRCVLVYCLCGDLLCLRTRTSAPIVLLALAMQTLTLTLGLASIGGWDSVCGCLQEAVDERVVDDEEAVVLRVLVGILGLRWWVGGCGE